MTSNAVDRLLTVSLQTASGIVSLDATGLQTDTRNTLSSYPPATKRKTNVNYYNEDSKHIGQKDQPAAESLRSEQSVAVDVSMLQGAALETPASLDPATLQPEQVSNYSNQREEHEEDISSHDAESQNSRNTNNSSRNYNNSSRGSGSRGSSHNSRGSHRSRLDTPGIPLGFMSGGINGTTPQNYSRKRVAVGRKRCYISNVASFEAFSTTEAEIDVRRAVDNLMTTVRQDQIKTGGPTHKGELWKTIEAFFDAIPFVGLEGGEKGQEQFTQYIRCMASIRQAIRAAMYDNYDPDVDHRTLIPNFSALDLARETIHTLEVGLKEAEKAVVNSVVATKTDVIMAFKKLKPKDREDLRVYLEKREDFKSPKDPKFSPYRKYSENKRKGIPRKFMGGNQNGAAAKWLLGGGGIMNKIKNSKLETKMQSQHIEIRRLQGELIASKIELEELRQNSESQGKHTLMEELCSVLGIDDTGSVHADAIIGRVKRMRRKNIDGALNLFEQQGTTPLYKENMKKLVEILDITTFESGSVEDEIILAVESLKRKVDDYDEEHDSNGNNTNSNTENDGKPRRKFKLKSIGAMIKRMNATEKTMLHARSITERKAKLQQRKGAQKASKKEVKRFMKGNGNVSNDVSLCSLLHGMTVVAGKTIPSGINVNNTLAAIYEAKIAADTRADKTGKQRLSLAQYLRTFLVHQYGVKKLAMKHMLGIIKAIKKHRKSVPRLDLFARLVGMEEKDEHEYSSLAADYFLVVVIELFRSLSIKKLSDEDGLDIVGMMRDGITKKKLLTNSEISSALQNVDMGRGDRQKIMKHIQKGKSWDVDQFLTQVMDCWYESHHARLMKTEQVFFDSDENGDGELTLDEFTVAVKVLEPHCPDYDIVELYDRIAGDDGVIDAEEFAQGVTLLHSHMIQHQRRIREERRRKQIEHAATTAAKKNAKLFGGKEKEKKIQPQRPLEDRPEGQRSSSRGLGIGI